MNERIEKLWDEAADSIAAIPNGRNNFWETQENFMEKFAELIVQECLNIANREHKLALEFEWDNDDTAQSIKDSIRKHFGVEE